MGTKVAVIYGNTDRKIHRILIPNDDGTIVPSLAATGETMVTVILSVYNTYRSHQALAVSLGLVG